MIIRAAVLLPLACADFGHSDDGNLTYAYYRKDNYDSSATLPAVTAAGVQVSAWTRTWESAYSIYDSPSTVHVKRFDIAAKEVTHLGSSESFLKLTNGAAYFFTTAPNATLKEVTAGEAHSFGSELKLEETDPFGYNSIAWASKGSCVSVSVNPPGAKYPDRNVSVLVVGSGDFTPEFFMDKAGCEAGTIEVGYTKLHNNPVNYKSVGPCSKPLSGPGGAKNYDDLDAPIGPLAMHYHTRGALYYVSLGSSVYDKGVPALQSGELRFVQSGYYYGPETMTTGAYISSLHEPDPSARRVVPPNATSTAADDDESDTPTCAFACFDDSSNATNPAEWLQCVRDE